MVAHRTKLEQSESLTEAKCSHHVNNLLTEQLIHLISVSFNPTTSLFDPNLLRYMKYFNFFCFFFNLFRYILEANVFFNLKSKSLKSYSF